VPRFERNSSLRVRGGAENLVRAEVIAQRSRISPGESGKAAYAIYLGPKEMGHLRQVGADAEKLVDFGWFTVVGKPLLWFLKHDEQIHG